MHHACLEEAISKDSLRDEAVISNPTIVYIEIDENFAAIVLKVGCKRHSKQEAYLWVDLSYVLD